ncbi:protein Wiz isoform X6 [Rhineura floridana]|uniref:protein Wiz isoform X6 n=1 Tax=Rhineura floridana TaxID=261503 RepID=UPI002AC84E4D|nr:protein Wiz isoform X6 [Rhineura floridana]
MQIHPSLDGWFLELTQQNPQGMEKAVSTPLTEQQTECEDDGEKNVLMTLVSNKEDCAALECPQGEERITAFFKDAKTSLESVALLGASKEGGIVLRKPVRSSSEKLEAMSREGKVTDEMCNRKDDPSFLSPFTHQQPDDALEACKMTDQPNPSPCGIVSISTRRKEACTKAEEHLKLRKGCYKTKSRGSADQRSVTALWDCSTQERMGSVSKEESTLKKLPCLKDSASSKAAARKNPSYPKEPTSAMETNIIKTVEMNTDELGELEHLDSGKAAVETSPPPTGAQTVSGDERYHSNEPKQLEAFSKEHLEKRQELEKKGFRRFDWLSEHNEGLRPPYRNINKPVDVATNLSVRGQSAREASLLALPVFKKMLNPHLSKAKTVESALSPRKGQAADSDLPEVSSANTAEWALQKSGHQTATDLSVRKHAWTVNAGDAMERIPLQSVESPSCSTYDETRPYMCNVLLEEQGKDDVGQEEDPAVYTCIECSIYFKMKEHLMDHMLQHNRGLGPDQGKEGIGSQYQLTCNECGWAFGDIGSLQQHRRLHQESREKIIEEIQKLNEFPDEGRDARLQCPKCVFGTNSSKVFVQHAKMHVKERKDQRMKNVNLFGSSGGSEPRDSSIHNVYRHFRPNDHVPQVAHAHNSNKSLSTCMLCSFPAPNENILKEHMKYAHSHLSWNAESFESDLNQPGTSRDAYSPSRSGRHSETDYLSKADRHFLQSHCETMPHYESLHGFTAGHQRLNKSNGTNKKDIPMPGFRARKRAPYSSSHKILGMSTHTSAKSYSPYALKQIRNKSTALPLETEKENAKSHPGGLEELQHKWLPMNDIRSMEEEFPLATEIELAENRFFRHVAIPQSAVDLKMTFRGILKATDYSIASAGQQHQLRQMIPIVLVEEINLYPRKMKRPNMKILKKKMLPTSQEFGMDESLPLGVFLLDPSLEGSLELDDLLDDDSSMLKNEERKCPYCPDRFHNGIGLANHVRGHLNRVGVSYNVRHFISAEEVKAIEQKFSFQKKKKKGIANFDPSTFSLMRCEFCGAGFDTRAGLSSHARAHLRDFGITNWELTISPINILKELLANSSEYPMLQSALGTDPSSPNQEREMLGFGPCKSTTPISECSISQSPFSPFPPSWGDEPMQSFRDVMASEEEEEMVTAEMGLPPLQKKGSLAASLDQIPNRIGSSLSPEPSSNRADSQDSKTSGAEPVRDIRCEFCGEYFENRKGLSSHARSHLRQMGVTEWYVNGSPIDTLREILKRRAQPRTSTSNSPAQSQKSLASSVLGGSLEPRSPGESHMPAMPKKAQQPGSPMGHSPTSSPPPTARKIFSGLSSPSLHKKLKQDQLRMEIKREMMSGGVHNESHLSDRAWSPREEMSPLNLSSRADPVRDIRCEFCGEFFENRKGLSSHARSHLRQMGVTEWSVNGSPIDTLREIIKKKNKPCLIKKEPNAMSIELPKPMGDDGADPKSPGKMLQPMALSPLGGRTGKPNLGREVSLSPLKSQEGFLTPLSSKRPLSDERLCGHSEVKQKTYIQTELPFKAKHVHEKPTHTSTEACCELCGLYFENRKALASHARAHLRQFGVTEWCVNGSPIETLSEWIKHRPQKAGAYRSYIQGGRPFTKKFRNASHVRDNDASGKRVPLSLQTGSPPLANRSLGSEIVPSEPSKAVDGGGSGSSSNSSERPAVTSPLSLVKMEEHQQHNINKFERRQAKPIEVPPPQEEETNDLQQKVEEVRQPPPRVRPVPSLVPRPPQTSLVKFVGNIYTLKCRFCEVEFQGPLSIQEEWVRHLQRHILETNFSKADALRSGTDVPVAPSIAEAQ